MDAHPGIRLSVAASHVLEAGLEAINLFFTQNRPLIYFIGGLSFFSMGLASALQRRRYSRLRLAQWLYLLAWFGILYGLNEWGNLLIPLQETLPVPETASWMAVLQLAVRGLALALLFQFGIELLRPPTRAWRWVRLLPGGMILLWVIALLHLGIGMRAPGDVVFSTGDTLARYLLGLPAAALSCLGLLEQRREVREAGFPQIARYILGAAISLGFFGLVGSLMGVAGPFYPGEWLGYPVVLYTIGVFVPILRALDGLAMAFFTSRALNVFEAEAERTLTEIEQRNLLLADRERISRELHDGIIQSLYAAGLRLEAACQPIDEPREDNRNKIRGVMDSLNQVIREIRAYIFDLQEMGEEGSLIQRLTDLVRETRLNTLLEAEFHVHGTRCAYPPQRVPQLCQIVQEALSNATRHARAHRAQVDLFFEPDTLRLEIQDNGHGFDLEQVQQLGRGLGLRTMGDRAALLGGTLLIDTQPGAGTRVTVQVPCPCGLDGTAKECGCDEPE
jgi:signal transduction histidine kinase